MPGSADLLFRYCVTENKELKPSKEVSVSASYLSFFGVFFGFCGLLKCQGLCNMI